MISVPRYMDDFEEGRLVEHPNNAYLPHYLNGPFYGNFKRDQKLNQNDQCFNGVRGLQEPQLGILEPVSIHCLENPYLCNEPENTFWIAVSSYQLDRAYLVYRFFQDIGYIAAKSFTNSNLMYIKYYSSIDCQIALSYDGQKIGYGGDIRVNVKPENPAVVNTIIVALEMELKATNEKLPCYVKMKTEELTIVPVREQIAANNEHELIDEEEKKGEKLQILPKKLGFLEWLRMKLSYVFYFY